MNLLKYAMGLVVAVALTACGGGGGSPGLTSGSTPTPDTPVTPVALTTTAPASGLIVGVGVSQEFNIKGGKPPYLVTSSNVQIATGNVKGNIVAINGVTAGAATILVSDAEGTSTTIQVTIGNAVALYTTAPATLTVARDTQSNFVIGGGVAAYTVTSSDARIAAVSLSGSTMSVIGLALGNTTLTVRDAANATLNIAVTVATGSTSALYTTAPSPLSMAAGSSASYQVNGGAQPYVVTSSDSRLATGSISGSTLTISALMEGTATLQIVDATGKPLPVVVTVDGTSGAAGPATIEILPSSGSLSSAPGSKVTFIVTVKNNVNTAIPKQAVIFTASSGTLTGANPAPITDASGSISTVSLSPGADFSNRAITVTATAGSASKSINIPVAGTSLSIAGPGSALAGSSALAYSVKAVDSGGKPISGAVLTFTSALGNGLSPKTATTDLAGSATFNYTPGVAGTDTLKVEGLGATASATVAISNEDFSFITPIPGAKLGIAPSSTAVTVRFKVAGAGVAGKTVTFSTTRGTLSAPTAVTNGSGEATVDVSSTTAGPVTVSAQLDTARSSVTASFVATIPATIVLQANPGAVPPNASGSTTNQSTLSATVRDATGNPVAGQVVNFTAVSDGSNGSIVPGSGTTDANGMTSVQFIPGALSTPANGVQIRATVQDDTSIISTARLTVNGEALFISIGVAGSLNVFDSVTYEKNFSVYVTDANGAPASGRPVSLSIYPTQYGKGVLVAGTEFWVYSATSPTSCDNEDLNKNGILDAGEDVNVDGRLTPGMPVTITPAAVTTDASGYASFNLRYGKNYAMWLKAEITARALVGGTESSQVGIHDLGMTLEDAKITNGTPANRVSPFGVATSCSDKN